MTSNIPTVAVLLIVIVANSDRINSDRTISDRCSREFPQRAVFIINLLAMKAKRPGSRLRHLRNSAFHDRHRHLAPFLRRNWWAISRSDLVSLATAFRNRPGIES